jgi:hypothetical protein
LSCAVESAREGDEPHKVFVRDPELTPISSIEYYAIDREKVRRVERSGGWRYLNSTDLFGRSPFGVMVHWQPIDVTRELISVDTAELDDS